MQENKRKICGNAFFMFGGACGVLLLSLINIFMFLNPIGILGFIIALIAAGVSIIAIFFTNKPARDGIFSAVLILHIVTVVLTFLSLDFIMAIVILIVAAVFDSLYEGLENSRDKNPNKNNVRYEKPVSEKKKEIVSNYKPVKAEVGDLVIRDLRKDFGTKHVLKDVSMTFKPGHIYGFLGNNGAGKTTTMRILFNMELATSGKITYNGKPRSKIDYSNWFYFTETDAMPTSYAVRNYLEELTILYGIPHKEYLKRLDEVTEIMDFNFGLNQRISSLSSGQQKIVGCMGLLMVKPDVVFLDEPTANMDVWNQKIVIKMIQKLHDSNRIVVITTHLLKEIGDLLTDVIILDNGEVKYEAPVSKKDSIEKIFKKYTTDGIEEADFSSNGTLETTKKKKKKNYQNNSFDKKMIGEYLNEQAN